MTTIDGKNDAASEAPAPRRPRPVTTIPRTPLRAVAVTLPARDEQELLGACLDALESAAWRVRRRGLEVFALVIADACTDATRAVARSRGISCLTVNRRNVGAARAAGAAHALAELSQRRITPAQTLLLHTDADTLVPSDWITRHVEAARAHDAVVGAVAAVEPRVRVLPGRGEPLNEPEPEPRGYEFDVRGANLGVRGDAYLRAGGFPALVTAEDRALTDALQAAGESVFFAPDILVHTSTRISHRIHRGLAAAPAPAAAAITTAAAAAITITTAATAAAAAAAIVSPAAPEALPAA